jgi:hypothetical protein
MARNERSKQVRLKDNKYCEWCNEPATVGFECLKNRMGTGIWVYACNKHTKFAHTISGGTED